MPHRRWKIIACLFLVVATLAVYGDLRTHRFINYDDNVYVTDNPMVRGGLTLPGLIGAFTSNSAGLWHPLTMLSQMLDCQLFGLHPGGHHLTSLLFHLAYTLLLFLWLQRTTGAFPLIQSNLGLALAAQGRLDQAVAQYAEALRLNSDLAETENNLGVALAKQGKLEEAIVGSKKPCK